MNFTEEARKILERRFIGSLPNHLAALETDIAAALEAADKAAYERGRMDEQERCAALIVKNAIQNIGSGGKELVPRDDGNKDGLFYAEAIRNQP